MLTREWLETVARQDLREGMTGGPVAASHYVGATFGRPLSLLSIALGRFGCVGEVFLTLVVAAGALIGMPMRAVEVATRLVPVRVAVPRHGRSLRDLHPDLPKHFAADLLILLERSALASSAIRHEMSPLNDRNVTFHCPRDMPLIRRRWQRRNRWLRSVPRSELLHGRRRVGIEPLLPRVEVEGTAEEPGHQV